MQHQQVRRRARVLPGAVADIDGIEACDEHQSPLVKMRSGTPRLSRWRKSSMIALPTVACEEPKLACMIGLSIGDSGMMRYEPRISPRGTGLSPHSPSV